MVGVVHSAATHTIYCYRDRIVLRDLAVKSIQLNDPKMRMTADQVELKVDSPIYS